MPSPPGLLTLYIDAFWASPYDATCHAALARKGLRHSTSSAMVREGQGLAAIYESNAVIGRVPVLRHGDFWLTESMAIVEYLEELCPDPEWPRLYPADLRLRARARQLMLWLRTDLRALKRERPSTLVFYRQETRPLGEEASADAAELLAVAGRLLPDDGGFLFGDWSIADVDLTLALMRLVRSGHAVPDRIAAFAERLWAEPTLQPFVSHARPPYPPH